MEENKHDLLVLLKTFSGIFFKVHCLMQDNCYHIISLEKWWVPLIVKYNSLLLPLTLPRLFFMFRCLFFYHLIHDNLLNCSSHIFLHENTTRFYSFDLLHHLLNLLIFTSIQKHWQYYSFFFPFQCFLSNMVISVAIGLMFVAFIYLALNKHLNNWMNAWTFIRHLILVLPWTCTKS